MGSSRRLALKQSKIVPIFDQSKLKKLWATKAVVTLDLNNASLNQFLDCFRYSAIILKFELSENHTEFEKNLTHGFDKSADLLSKRQNHEEDFFKIMCASQKVRSGVKVHVF